MKEVAVTGFGVVLPGCDTPEQMWAQLRDGKSQLKFQPDPADPTRRLALGRIEDFRPERYLKEIPERAMRLYDRETQLYLSSLYSAIGHAKVDFTTVFPERVGLFDGCSRPMFAAWYERLRGELTGSTHVPYSRRDLMLSTPGLAVGLAASLLEVRGSTYTFNGTCSAGAIALGHAYREVAGGLLDVAFATGHESALVPPLFEMYREANLLSLESEDPAHAVRPFSDCIGNAFGEGAVTLVLEPRELAEARGATCFAMLSAYQYGNNGFHPTTPDLVGGRPARLILQALAQAKLGPADVGFVVGHGNGVQTSDASETNYLLLAFGDEARRVPLLSNKPIWGHTLGASSAVNAAAAALMLHHQFVAPTINVSKQSANPDFNHMPGRGEARALTSGLAVSFGLGGNNAILAFKRA